MDKYGQQKTRAPMTKAGSWIFFELLLLCSGAGAGIENRSVINDAPAKASHRALFSVIILSRGTSFSAVYAKA